MSKTFAQAPKPKPQLSAEVIAAFERGGAGQDTQTRAPTNVEKREDETQSHIPSKVAKRKAAEEVKEEPTARLSIDLPKSLHRRFKTACAKTDLKMVTEVMDFIERRTRDLEKG
jgi:hypothetical protein